MKMKLLIFVVLITIWVTVIARRHKNKKYYRDNRNETKEITILNDTEIIVPINIKGQLRKSFYLLCAESKPDSNTLCSPLSALLPLAKLALGAEGETLDELLAAIGVSKKSTIHSYFKSLLIRLRYLPGVKLDIASKLYVSERSHLHRGFRDSAREVFGSSVDKIDFTYPSYAAEEINSWVSSQTNGIIKDILQPIDISSTTSMVLVNAVYFNGRWTEPFQKVQNVTFYSPTVATVIDMMTRSGDFNYTKSEALGAQIISIPYSGDGASLVVVCPEGRAGLEALLGALRLMESALAVALGSLQPTRVKVTMPKFTVHHDLDLGKVYSKLGTKTIFDKTLSGLTKIVRDETVYITSAKHKCFIDVNEYGTEAAASTALFVAKLSHESPIELLVDHPFLYFILVNDEQLFTGTFVNPEYLKHERTSYG